MQALTRFASVLATCAASLAVVVVLACDKEGSGSPPPAPAGDGTPAASPEATPPPAAGDAAVVEPGAPTESTGANVTCTPDTRKGGMCTREYSPVCGTLADNTSKTFANKCVACSDEKVMRYVAGPCPGEPPA